MTVQMSDLLRNDMLDAITTRLGAGWKLKLRTGAQPATVATASSGTVIATFTPTATAASSGTKVMVSGTPIEVNASAAGTIGHYELTTSGDVVHERGSVTATGAGGDMTVDNTSVTSGQAVRITAFTKTAPGA
jgi:hypothetical protein